MSQEKNQLYKIRHSAAHILYQAVARIFGKDVKQAIGPVTENGFFYDLLAPSQIKESDLEKIELEMRKIVSENFLIIGRQVSKDEARQLYQNNPFKLEIIDRIESETVGIYTQGEMFDLCQGGHTESTGEVLHFKLTAIAGSYWRGDKNNPQLQRISGIAFETAEDLKKYETQLELAKKYDHRITGKEQELFLFLKEAPGMVFFLPKGFIVYNLIIEYVRTLLKKYNYLEVKTPVLMKEELWHESGHYENYKENMFFCTAGDEKYCLRPMNCPSHILLFKEGLRSYRELPLRIAEFGLVHRFELSGALHGLYRVRSFTQDDAHVFCSEDQINAEIHSQLKMALEIYGKFGFDKISVAIATLPDKSIGDDASWEKATSALSKALAEAGLEYSIAAGEGAFYGPKIEIFMEDSIGRKWQFGTIQVDFALPERFKAQYVAADQSRNTPVMIHRALLGSMERFLAICLEHYQAKLPFWLAPVQFKILTINTAQIEFGNQVLNQFLAAGFRGEVDSSTETISAKIRETTVAKVPLMFVIGAKEVEAQTVTIRYPDGKQKFGVTIEECLVLMKELSS
jgi:threonyl-tRNA synthetase